MYLFLHGVCMYVFMCVVLSLFSYVCLSSGIRPVCRYVFGCFFMYVCVPSVRYLFISLFRSFVSPFVLY